MTKKSVRGRIEKEGERKGKKWKHPRGKGTGRFGKKRKRALETQSTRFRSANISLSSSCQTNK